MNRERLRAALEKKVEDWREVLRADREWLASWSVESLDPSSCGVGLSLWCQRSSRGMVGSPST